MLAAIHLDDQPGLKGCEIHDIPFNGLLPPEFYSINPLGSQLPPQKPFSIRRPASEGFGVGGEGVLFHF